MTELKVKRLNNLAKIPTRGSDKAAGWDLYAASSYDIEIKPHTTVKIGTGLAIEPPAGTFVEIFPRSGLATKKGLRPANTPGVCDEDYRGEYMVALHNDTDQPQIVKAGERIAQMILRRYEEITFVEVDELSDTERGEGGFGSTGRV